MNLTAPSYITATCVDCGAYRTFEMYDASTTESRAEYRCEDCGKLAVLDLDP
jgi:DNA-directed RNA polymerase subunit RPC12/RpoP